MIPRPEFHQHPGEVDKERVLTKTSHQNIAFSQLLLPGGILSDELIKACRLRGLKSAGVNLVGGFLEDFEYCLGRKDPTVHNKINYRPPQKESAAVMLICANANIGIGEDGALLVHCHGLVSSHNGAPIGGHFVADKIRICKQPVTAFFTGLVGAGFRQMYDGEVTHSIFKPAIL